VITSISRNVKRCGTRNDAEGLKLLYSQCVLTDGTGAYGLRALWNANMEWKERRHRYSAANKRRRLASAPANDSTKSFGPFFGHRTMIQRLTVSQMVVGWLELNSTYSTGLAISCLL